jgi:hypothetical protein
MNDQKLAAIRSRADEARRFATTDPVTLEPNRWVPLSTREHFDHDVPELLAKVERLKGRLKELEWAGAYLDDDVGRWPACPACGTENPPYGAVYPTTPHHAPGCWLAAEIGGVTA